MAVAYGSSSSAVSTSASFNVAKPVSTASGDLLIAFQSSDSGSLGISGGSTWTELTVDVSGATTLGYRVAYKIAGGSEPTNYTATKSAGSDGHVTIIRLTGASGSAPVFAVDSSGQSGTSISTPSITPAGSADTLIRFVSGGTGGTGSAALTAPASHTLRTTQQSTTWVLGGSATRQLAAGGATGTASFTSNVALAFAVGITVGVTSSSVDASADLATVTATTAVPAPAVGAGAGAHPDTVTATTTAPTPAVSAGSNIHPDTVTAATAVPTPSITTDTAELVGLDTVTAATTVPTPSAGAGAGVSLATVAGAAAVPAPAVSSDASIVLPTVAVAAAVPSITVSVPILPGDQLDGSPGQMEWNGFVLGRTSFYRWRQLEGWRGKEPPDSGNAAHANRHGSAPGRPLAREKVVTWNGFIKASRDEVEAAVLALENATPLLRDSTQWPLVANDLGSPYLAYGRIDRVHIPLDKLARLGHIPIIVQWIMADTRRYNINATGVTCVKNVITDVGNAGNTETNPLIVIPGPAVTPRMTNHTLNRVLEFGVTLLDGEALVIDTDLGRARVGSTDVMGVRSFSSVSVWDWVLDRGTQQVEFTTASGGTQAEVLYRDAWI